MSREDGQRLEDIHLAITAIHGYVDEGGLADPMVFDAVRMRLIEIGEAVKDLDPGLLASEPGIPWTEIAGMRDLLAHRYWDTLHSIVVSTVEHDIPELAAATRRMRTKTTG